MMPSHNILDDSVMRNYQHFASFLLNTYFSHFCQGALDSVETSFAALQRLRKNIFQQLQVAAPTWLTFIYLLSQIGVHKNILPMAIRTIFRFHQAEVKLLIFLLLMLNGVAEIAYFGHHFGQAWPNQHLPISNFMFSNQSFCRFQASFKRGYEYNVKLDLLSFLYAADIDQVYLPASFVSKPAVHQLVSHLIITFGLFRRCIKLAFLKRLVKIRFSMADHPALNCMMAVLAHVAESTLAGSEISAGLILVILHVSLFIYQFLQLPATQLIIIRVFSFMKKKSVDDSITSILFKRKNLMTAPALNSLIAPKIQQIDLSENFMRNVNELSGYQFKRLRVLALNNNMLDDISGLANQQFPVLQKLLLYGNQIPELKPLCSMTTPNLTELKLGFKNNGNNISDDAMQEYLEQGHYPQLEELTIDCNEITGVRFLQFGSLTKLSLLYLSGNKIESIDASALNSLPSLKVLSFRNNYICSIQFMGRLNLPQLENLNIAKNLINEISDISKAALGKIQILEMHNPLVSYYSPCLKCEWPEVSHVQVFSQNFLFQPAILQQMRNKFLNTQ